MKPPEGRAGLQRLYLQRRSPAAGPRRTRGGEGPPRKVQPLFITTRRLRSVAMIVVLHWPPAAAAGAQAACDEGSGACTADLGGDLAMPGE